MCWHKYDSLGDRCFIYLVECDGYYKIGMTTGWPGRRLSSLQTSSPHEMELIDYFEGGSRLERILHYRYRDFRVRGEWFEKTLFIKKAFEDFSSRPDCEACAA